MRASGLLIKATVAATILLTASLLSGGAPAQSPSEAPPAAAAMQPGDMAVTGFSGAILAAEKIAPGVDPVDRTFIDPNGPALRIFDVSNFGGPAVGQLINPPVRLDGPARQIGQVFGLAVDEGVDGAPPNLYAAATSAFGLNIVGADRAADGKPVRLKTGGPGATFMEGQFGALSESSPGAIYKVDGTTGALTNLADTAFSGTSNSGPGIGGLAYDAASRSLYASDLDTGLVHRFGLDYNAADLSQYDHGVAGRRAASLEEVRDDGRRAVIIDPAFKADDPATWGFTQPQRRVDALAVRDGRLYYSVAEGPEIWSVGLNGGAFQGDARLEVKVKAQQPFAVTAIAFDGAGRMILAQRGAQKNAYNYSQFAEGGKAQVLRFKLEAPDDPATPGTWVPVPDEIAVGFPEGERMASGGVSAGYAYKPDGTIDLGTCGGSIAVTGDDLRNNPKLASELGSGGPASIHGVQIGAVDLVRPANVPPKQSVFVDFDGRTDDPDSRGYVGQVAILSRCDGAAGFPPVADGGGGGGGFPPVADGGGGGTTFPPVDEGGGGGGGTTFPPVDKGGGGGGKITSGPFTVEKTGVSEECNETDPCTFAIKVTNTTDAPVPGPITIEDTLSAGGASLANAKLSGAPNAPWTCTVAAAKFSCTHPGPLQPNTPETLTLSLIPGSLGAATEVQNCAALGTAPAPAPAGPAPVLPPPTKSEKNGIKFEQRSLTPSCTAGTACEWELKVTNTGAQPRTGSLIWHTEFAFVQDAAKTRATSVTIESATGTPAATCIPIPNNPLRQMTCTVGEVTIPPNQSFTTTLKVKAAAPAGAPAGGMQSTAFTDFTTAEGQTTGQASASVILAPPGQAAQPDQAVQDGVEGAPAPQACAVIPVKKPTPQVPVGPATAANGLQINKVVAPGAPCTNANCAFTITVKNTNATPMPGPIKVIDLAQPELPGGQIGPITTGKIVSGPTAPWTCAKRPPQNIDFECTHPGPLAAGETSTINMAIAFDAGVILDRIRNCGILDDNAFVCADAPIAQVQPPVPPAPPPPAADPNGLVLTKRRAADKCSDLGGGCAFIVRITNSSQAEFNGPIEFTDIIKTADGQALPNATLEAQPLVTLAEGAAAAITCTKAGDTVTCGTGGANAKIPPGKFVDAQLTMKPGPAGGATAVRNCALLKSGGGQSCSNMALVNGPLVRLTKFGGGDTCLPKCTFAVVVQNVGNADASGSFKFKDTFTPASSLGGFNTAPDGAECSQLNGLLFCVPKLKVLKPGELTSVVITVFGTAKAPEYKNCVDFVPQPQAPPGQLVLDTTNLGRCVTVKDTSPQTPNLVIRKQAPNRTGGSDGHCKLKGGCRFTITVTNTGLAPFTGPLRVTDKVSLGVPESISIGHGTPLSLPWKCDSVQNGGAVAQSSITCVLPPLPNGLAPGTTATLEVSVTPGTTWKGSDRLKNCAEITSDGEIGANAQKEDCAEVVLDPFNVKIAKSGDQQCPPGSDCTFKLTLFNPGPIPHNAPVTISDKLTGLSSAQIVSISPPLPCATQPTQIPFSCTSPGPVRLDLDAKPGDPFGPQEFVMVVRLPNDASAEQFSNCASVAGDANAASEEACHTVSTKPATPTGPCPGGQVMTARGCACPAPTKLKGGECVGAGGINTTPLPQTPPPAAPPPPVVTAPAPPSCSGGMILIEGRCACPALTAWNGRNCVPTSLRPPVVTAPASPSCSGGMILIEGSCACPQFMKWNGSKCVGTGGINKPRPADDEPAPAPQPRPPKKTTTDECPSDRPVGTFPNCCPSDTRFEDGVCKRFTGGSNNSKDIECPRSRPVGTPPNCCPKGTTFERGACREPAKEKPKVCTGDRPVGAFPNCCPRNMRFENGACRRPQAEPSKCPTGTIGTFPNCCPRGTRFENGKCRRPQAEPPQQQRPFEKTCPDGTKVFGQFTQCPSDKPKLPPQPQSCPRNRPNGTFPNCCPRQMQFRNGQCVDDKCRQGMVGTPPNCACPPGTQFLNDRCRVPAGPATKPTPPPPTCNRGFVLQNGKCVCPGVFLDGRCQR